MIFASRPMDRTRCTRCDELAAQLARAHERETRARQRALVAESKLAAITGAPADGGPDEDPAA